MDETTEVITPEIVSDDSNETSTVTSVAVGAFALVGAAQALRWAAKRVPFKVVRKNEESETPVIASETPVAAE